MCVALFVVLGLSEIHKTVASPEMFCAVFMYLFASFSEKSERGISIIEQAGADAEVVSAEMSVNAPKPCGDRE